MKWERFEHPSNDGTHNWTELAFDAGKQVGGITELGDGCRAYAHYAPVKIVRDAVGRLIGVDIGTLVLDFERVSDGRAFVEQNAKAY